MGKKKKKQTEKRNTKWTKTIGRQHKKPISKGNKQPAPQYWGEGIGGELIGQTQSPQHIKDLVI